MKNLLVTFIVVTVAVFIISFATADNVNAAKRVLYSSAFGALGAAGFYINCGKLKRVLTVNKKPMLKNKVVYVFPYKSKQFKYRVENGYVYEGMNNRYVYQIEKDKIYKGMSASPLFCIEGSQIYNYAGNRNIVYKIHGNLIYQGDFARVPLYEIKNNVV